MVYGAFTHPAAGQVTDYTTEILGLAGEPDLLETLQRASRLIRLQDQPPATQAGLSRRAESDLDTFGRVLRSEGFYQFELAYQIDAAVSPNQVDVTVDTGPVYLLADYVIVYEPPVPGLPTDLESLGLHVGMWARAEPIAAAQDQLLRDLANRGYPLAKVLDRNVVVDHAQTLMTVDLRVDPGPQATFGEVTVNELERIDREFTTRRIPWRRGDLYDQRLVDDFRATLNGSGLFTSVRVIPAATTAPDGSLPITVELREAKLRSLGAGANFSTSEGLEAIAFWEHRALFGAGEKLRLSVTAGEVEQKADAAYRIPGFGRLDQDFVSQIEVGREDTEAFRSFGANTSAGIERRLNDHWRVFAGGSLEFADIKDDAGDSQTKLFGVPLTATRETADSIFDATTGTRLTLATTPFFGRHRGTVAFAVTELNAAGFLPIDNDARFVLAGRTRIATIVGESTTSIPANHRLYAGGGGSVRGYELQSVGPLDADDDPIGGRSAIELGLELRARITDTIGIVPFIEGGQVFDDALPDFSEEPLWAAGLGLRYFTAVGPIRFDIATPINGRDRDDSFQFYISVGQAF